MVVVMSRYWRSVIRSTGLPFQVTASFGISAFPESKAHDGVDLVRRADKALYRAKKTGKNRVELFWSDDPSGMHKLAELARD